MKKLPRVVLGLGLLSLFGCAALPVDRNAVARHESVRTAMDNFREDAAKANREAVRDPSK